MCRRVHRDRATALKAPAATLPERIDALPQRIGPLPERIPTLLEGLEGDGANPYGLGQGLELGDQARVAGVVEVGDHVAQGSTCTEHLPRDVHVVVADDGVEPGQYARHVAVQVEDPRLAARGV